MTFIMYSPKSLLHIYNLYTYDIPDYRTHDNVYVTELHKHIQWIWQMYEKVTTTKHIRNSECNTEE